MEIIQQPRERDAVFQAICNRFILKLAYQNFHGLLTRNF